MKNRVLSMLLACVMIVSSFIISRPTVKVHAVEGDTDSGEKITYVSDLYMDKTVDGQFFIGGMRYSDKTVLEIEGAPSETWSPAWPGNWLTNREDYVTILPEWNTDTYKYDERLRFCMVAGESYGALIGFTAPADGVFDIDALFRKVNSGNPRLTVMKSDGTVIEYYDIGVGGSGWGVEVDIDVDGIELKKNEQIYIVLERGNFVSGQTDVGVISFEVTATYSECVHEYGDDSVCDNCGLVCQHEGGVATCNALAICDICNQEYGSYDVNNHSDKDGSWTVTDTTHAFDRTCCDINDIAETAHVFANYYDGVECIICDRQSSGIIVNYVSDLTVNKPHNGQFFVAGIKLSDKSVIDVEDSPRTVWGSYVGHWLVNGDDYVTTNTEDKDDPTLKFDMMPSDTYGAAVGFTAPADGIFGVNAELRKVWSGTTKVTLMKDDGTEIWSTNVVNNNATAVIDVDGIQLEKGEKLLIVVTKVSGGINTALRTFTVEAFYEECPHYYGSDNICDYCRYDCTLDKANENLENALDNYFNGASNSVTALGPNDSLDSYKVAVPMQGVNGVEYLLFNLRFENSAVILRHHFLLKGSADLYTVTVNGEKVMLVNEGADIYYFETVGEIGSLHVPDAIKVTKGGESVEFGVSVYSYLAIAFKQSKDEKVNNVLKALYDVNEASYTEEDEGAILSIFVDSSDIATFESSRPYDESKEDISLILVIGQSNFTYKAGYAWEYNHNYIYGYTDKVPVSPTVPGEGKAYSFHVNSSSFVLNGDSDMSYLSSPDRKNACIGGVTPAFGTRWNALTDTKVVFIQAAVESTGIHEWVKNPEDYTCNCNNYGAGKCYSDAVSTYNAAYAELSQNYNVVYTGYIFNQGEHDEGNRAGATVCDEQSYYDAYKSMHEALMSELSLDFGGISVVRANEAGDTAEASTSYTKARYAQYKLCNDIDDLYMLSTVSETCTRDMMDQGNTIHYSQEVFNDMGKDMANNLYSCLGLGETNAYDGIKVYSKNGYLLTHVGADGEIASGNATLTEFVTLDRILVKTSALGREDAVSYKIFVDGVDCTRFIDQYGQIDWEGLEATTGYSSLKVKVTVK